MRDNYKTTSDFNADYNAKIEKWWDRSINDFGQVYPRSMFYFPEELSKITSSSRSITFNPDKFYKESEVIFSCKIEDTGTTEYIYAYKAMRDRGWKNTKSPLVRAVRFCCDTTCFCCNRVIDLYDDVDLEFRRSSVAAEMTRQYNLFIAKASDSIIESICTSCMDKYQNSYGYSSMDIIHKFNNSGDYGELEVLMGLIQAKTVNIGDTK
jgi:hypothetical protein